MTVRDAFLIHLGPIAVKAIMKLWFQDSAITLDASEKVSSIVGQKISDLMDQKECIRQFEEIGDKVSDSVYQVVKSKGYSIEDDDIINLVIIVKDILELTQIDERFIFDHDLSPEKLSKAIDTTRIVNGIEIPDKAFPTYKNISRELGSLIVDIANQLPAFTSQAFSEILKRERKLVRKVDEVIEMMKKIRKEVNNNESDMDIAAFEADYLINFVRIMDYLTLFGLDDSYVQRQQLSVSYINLMMNTPSGSSTNSNKKGTKKKYFNVAEVLSQTDRVLVTGNAGSGKTTLLQWVGVRSASGDFDDASGWGKRIPFFIKLRNYVDSSLPKLDCFVSDTIPFSSTLPPNWVRNKLKSGEAIVLIDGVDEIPKLKRVELENWVVNLISMFPYCKYIITTRPHATKEYWLKEHDFKEAELQLMDIDEINEFIDHWHQAVANTITNTEDKNDVLSYPENLKKVINETRSLKSLASTPLLCAVLCALHRKHREHLPRNRVELYEECCKMLVERRDLQRKVSLKDYPNLTYSQKMQLLQSFSYYLMKNNWTSVSVTKVDKYFETQLTRLVDFEGYHTGKDVRELLVERSSIIREPVYSVVDFTHKTFQEYLAAKAITYEEDLGYLLEKAQDDMWREVVILAAGIASKGFKRELLNGLLDIGDSDVKLRHQAYLLAVACLETSVEMDKEIKHRIMQGLSLVVPPNSYTEAKYISSAGELALPYLRIKGKKYNVKATSSCIRALSLIGGARALDYIAEAKYDSRVTVQRELSRGISFFDNVEYAQRVIQKDEKTHSYKVYDSKVLPKLHSVPDLDRITLYRCDVDTKQLQALDNTKFIYFYNSFIFSSLYSPSLINCELASFCYCSLQDISDFLSYTRNVSTLYIFHPFYSVDDMLDLREILPYPVDKLYIITNKELLHNFDTTQYYNKLYAGGGISKGSLNYHKYSFADFRNDMKAIFA